MSLQTSLGRSLISTELTRILFGGLRQERNITVLSIINVHVLIIRSSYLNSMITRIVDFFMEELNMCLQMILLCSLVITEITIVFCLWLFMCWLKMTLKIFLYCSLIIALSTRISDTFMFTLNMLLQTCLCTRLYKKRIRCLTGMERLYNMMTGSSGHEVPVMVISCSGYILRWSWPFHLVSPQPSKMAGQLPSSQQDDRIAGIPAKWLMAERINLNQNELARGNFLPTMSANVSRMDQLSSLIFFFFF